MSKMRVSPPWRFPVGIACLISVLAGPALAQTPHSALLEQAAWKALDAGQPEPAANAFREALTSDPRNPRLHLGVATAAYALRRDVEARAALELALALNPKLYEARALLGRVLYRSGDLNGAIVAFEALEREGVLSTSLTDTLNRWRREAELRDRMSMAFGSGFTVAFEGPEDEALAQQALASVERAAARISAVMSHYPTTSIAVVLYTNAQFRDITRSPSWAGGAFDGTIRIPMRGALANVAELDRVLAHEYTHALVHDLAKSGVPAWLNEGLAAALEREEPQQRKSTDLAAGSVPLRSLQTSFGRLTGAEAERAYAAGAFAVQRLMEEAGGMAITNLLRDIGDGVAFDAAFVHRMQRTFSDFEASRVRP
jgi:tetratricopeptide (TPR) repeat protein